VIDVDDKLAIEAAKIDVGMKKKIEGGIGRLHSFGNGEGDFEINTSSICRNSNALAGYRQHSWVLEVEANPSLLPPLALCISLPIAHFNGFDSIFS
jgi:hypothetical protein